MTTEHKKLERVGLVATPKDWREIADWTEGANTPSDALVAAYMAWNLAIDLMEGGVVRRCNYCDNKAFGYELEYFEREVGEIQVCYGCAHHGATVHKYDGGTWRRDENNKETKGE